MSCKSLVSEPPLFVAFYRWVGRIWGQNFYLKGRASKVDDKGIISYNSPGNRSAVKTRARLEWLRAFTVVSIKDPTSVMLKMKSSVANDNPRIKCVKTTINMWRLVFFILKCVKYRAALSPADEPISHFV